MKSNRKEEEGKGRYLQQLVIGRFRLQIAAVRNGLFECGGFGNHRSDFNRRTGYIVGF